MSERWTPDSWRTRPVLQVPDYPDAKVLADVEAIRQPFVDRPGRTDGAVICAEAADRDRRLVPALARPE